MDFIWSNIYVQSTILLETSGEHNLMDIITDIIEFSKKKKTKYNIYINTDFIKKTVSVLLNG